MKSARLLFLLAVVLTMTFSAVAQEGHPLTGTWYGDFGMTANQRNDLTVIMKWDGQKTTGMINPGPNVTNLQTAALDDKWNVHFEVDAKNKAGGMDHFVFDGVIKNPIAGNRTIVGTWTCGNTKGDFRLRRL